MTLGLYLVWTDAARGIWSQGPPAPSSSYVNHQARSRPCSWDDHNHREALIVPRCPVAVGCNETESNRAAPTSWPGYHKREWRGIPWGGRSPRRSGPEKCGGRRSGQRQVSRLGYHCQRLGIAGAYPSCSLHCRSTPGRATFHHRRTRLLPWTHAYLLARRAWRYG